jgi:hypothetical protein
VFSRDGFHLTEFDLLSSSPGENSGFYNIDGYAEHDSPYHRQPNEPKVNTGTPVRSRDDYLWLISRGNLIVWRLSTRERILNHYIPEHKDKFILYLPGYIAICSSKDQKMINLINLVTGQGMKCDQFQSIPVTQTYSTPFHAVLLGMEMGSTEITRTIFNVEKDVRKWTCVRCDNVCLEKLVCGECISVFYCSKECQRLHWPRHQLHCRHIALSNSI